MNETQLEWLYANAGPIIRWRLVKDFGYPVTEREASKLRASVLASEEVQRWLGNLGGKAIHGSKDTDAENAMAKLVEYGLHAGMAAFDELALPYAEKGDKHIDVFLLAAGYGTHPGIQSRFRQRLAALHHTAACGNYDFHLRPEEATSVPKAWRGKPIYRADLGWDDRPLPTCYDVYAMAHWEHGDPLERARIAHILRFVSAPEFQSTPGGYLWDKTKNTCYAAGRVWLACLNPERRVLFVEIFARFKETHPRDWFQDALSQLEECRTGLGTYIFPSEFLKEKRNRPYLYQGAHMGLGENRRQGNWIELESTFRMLNIRRLMNLGVSQAGVPSPRGNAGGDEKMGTSS